MQNKKVIWIIVMLLLCNFVYAVGSAGVQYSGLTLTSAKAGKQPPQGVNITANYNHYINTLGIAVLSGATTAYIKNNNNITLAYGTILANHTAQLNGTVFIEKGYGYRLVADANGGTFTSYCQDSVTYPLVLNMSNFTIGFYGAGTDNSIACEIANYTYFNVSYPNIAISFNPNECFLDKSLSWIMGYTLITLLFFIMFIVNLIWIRIPVFSIILGFGFILVTLSTYGCGQVIGACFTIFGLMIAVSDLWLYLLSRK